MLLAALFGAATVVASSPDCSATSIIPTDDYEPAPYEPTWAIKEASSYTTVPMITVDQFSAIGLDGMMADPYLKQIIFAVIVAAAFLLFFNNCVLCCCCCLRSKNCCDNCCERYFVLPCKSPGIAKLVLVVCFGVLFCTAWIGFKGRTDITSSLGTFKTGITTLVENLDLVAKDLEKTAQSTTRMVQGTNSIAQGACDFTNPDPTNVTKTIIAQQLSVGLRDGAQQIVDVANSLDSQVQAVNTDVKSNVQSLKSTADENIEVLDATFEAYVDPGLLASVLVFVGTAVFGIIGAFMCHKTMCCVTCSVGWIIVTVVVILGSVELVLGIFLADLCVPSPLDHISSTFEKAAPADGFGVNAIGYFITCQGANPFENVKKDILNGTDILRNQTCALETTLTEAVTMGTQYGLTQTDAGKCTEATKDIVGGAAGAITNSLNGVGKAISCKLFNQPIVIILEQGLCSEFSSGIYSLYSSQISGCAFLFVALYAMIMTQSTLDGTREDGDRPSGSKRGVEMA